MTILITGSSGFIGKNLKERLKNTTDYKFIEYDSNDSFKKIEESIGSIDCIVHLAGVCRSENTVDFVNTNFNLTDRIVNLILKKEIPIIFTSSIQAGMNNDYGITKSMAEDSISKLKENGYIIRLHNVFGKYAKWNHHSVVANFCYNAVNDLPLKIDNRDTEIEFVYIDDVIDMIMKLIDKKIINKLQPFYIDNRYKITIGELADKIISFKNGNEKILDEFTERLYFTYLSYKGVEK